MKKTFNFITTIILFLYIHQTSANCFFEFDTDLVFSNDFEKCDKQFYFEQLNSDKLISGTSEQIVIQKSITVSSPSKLLAVSDGRFAPINGPSGFLRIEINDDEQYSSYAIHDWSTGTNGNSGQHSFNVIAYRELPIGTYLVTLVASAEASNSGDFVVGSGSALSIMIDPSLKIKSDALNGESSQIEVTTYDPPVVDINEGDADRPFVEILATNLINTVSPESNIISVVAGRSFQSCTGTGDSLGGQGDALWGFWANDICQNTNEASWGVNDLYEGAELQAPMYAHSLHSLSHLEAINLKFGASELSFGSDISTDPSLVHENDVCYKVGNARMFSVLNDGISGGIGGDDTFCSTYRWQCVATTIGSVGCPSANSDVTISSTIINIPVGHSGVLFFSAKTRLQAGSDIDTDSGVRFGIKIDGVKVGTLGFQEFHEDFTASVRSLTASYLSAVGTNSSPLTAGNHTIEAYINYETENLKWAFVPNELVLTYFDFD